MKRFEDKVILVTGAAGGIGEACAKRFAEEGGAVLCVDVQEEPLNATVADITATGAKALAQTCDISDEAAVKALFAKCIAEFGKLDVLSHHAGIIKYAHAADMDFQNWRKLMSVNLDGTFLMCREALPHLEAVGGNIVNTSSSSALRGLAYGAGYAATKGGVYSLTKALAIEYIRRGVRVNCVCPAGIETAMTMVQRPDEDMDMELLMHQQSVAPYGKPANVASVVAALASDDCAFVNGSAIRIDGGALS